MVLSTIFRWRIIGVIHHLFIRCRRLLTELGTGAVILKTDLTVSPNMSQGIGAADGTEESAGRRTQTHQKIGAEASFVQHSALQHGILLISGRCQFLGRLKKGICTE